MGALGLGGASCDLPGPGRATTVSGVFGHTGLTGLGLWSFGAIPVVLSLDSELCPGGETTANRVTLEFAIDLARSELIW